MMEKSNKKINMSAHIPYEIILEILSRLPVESLCLFKSVSKSWDSIISDPNFNYSTKVKERAIVCASEDGSPGKIFYSINPELSLHQLPNPRDNGKKPLVIPEESEFQFLGSCHGLLLIRTWRNHTQQKIINGTETAESVYLWNPTTSSCRELSFMAGRISTERPSRVVSGLCFDESRNDYKAVILSSDRPRLKRRRSRGLVYVKVNAQVASLGRKRVRTVSQFPFNIICHSNTVGVLANGGNLHWVVEARKQTEWILCFDKVNDLFDRLPMPEKAPNYGQGFRQLGVLHGCLCLVLSRDNGYGNGFSGWDSTIWIMREYGVKESWTTLMDLPNVYTYPNLAILADRYFLFCRSQCYVYSTDDGSRGKHINLSDYQRITEGAVVYGESLVSVNILRPHTKRIIK